MADDTVKAGKVTVEVDAEIGKYKAKLQEMEKTSEETVKKTSASFGKLKNVFVGLAAGMAIV